MKNLFHGYVLSVINLLAIILGYAIYYLFKPVNQIAIQLPVAIIISCLGFAIWAMLSQRLNFLKNTYTRDKNYIMIYAFSFVWTPLIFIPIHFLTQGYITSFENIYYTWLFQAITNLIVLLITKIIYYTKYVENRV